MSYLLLHRDATCSLFAARPLIPAEALGHLAEALGLLRAAQSLRADMATRVADAEARGAVEGHRAGLAAGEADAVREQSAWLFDANLKAAEARAAMRRETAALVVAALRRVAGELGPDTVVAGLAERAVADLAPDRRMTVKVAPARLESVAARLRHVPLLSVEPDPGLGDSDCVIETSLGRTLAGLDVQIETLGRRWAALGPARAETADG
jgi:flagellar biosynthesis/type III secretory pathway protein FliH